jgi:pyruvate formate lyase activating enzyme
VNSPLYYQPGKDGLRCRLCPHACFLKEGETGICGVRGNSSGRMSLPCYARLSGFALDPIEKKPLYHFFPGRNILSAGFYGCNLRCPFCQNYGISREFRRSADSPETPPAGLVTQASRGDTPGIAYTYSEPLVHFEYLLECAGIARSQGLKNILVSNGFINETPARELLPLLDAANIDLKSFSPDFYREELGGDLKPVLRFLELASASVHLEVTTLIIPGKNDSLSEITEISSFLAGLNPDIPLHLSCYRPMYRYTLRPATWEDIRPLLDAARQKLRYVYPGNVRQESNTVCPSCAELLIRRQGYNVQIKGLRDGRCARCGREIAGVWG